MIGPGEINLAHVKAEVQAIFDSYEAALMRNDLDALNDRFWQSQLVVRFGDSENLYGIEAILSFRNARTTGALQRSLINTNVTTFGEDFATTTTEFVRSDHIIGRQSQTWVRFQDGWRIVSAHISLIDSNFMQHKRLINN